jgi:hypothetical protein
MPGEHVPVVRAETPREPLVWRNSGTLVEAAGGPCGICGTFTFLPGPDNRAQAEIQAETDTPLP